MFNLFIILTALICVVISTERNDLDAPECNVKGSGFTLVREVKKAYAKSHPATDNLAGTDVYNYGGSSAWTYKYDDWTFSHFLFRTVNGNKWLVTTKAWINDPKGVNGVYSILCSYYFTQTPFTKKWVYRSDVPEDPYVTYDDYSTNKKGTILYFENDWDGVGWESDNYFLTMDDGDGLQVWVDKNNGYKTAPTSPDFAKTV